MPNNFYCENFYLQFKVYTEIQIPKNVSDVLKNL